ncbi:MAG: GGDEF domain-containing protein [Dehalococcoidia bacterium]
MATLSRFQPLPTTRRSVLRVLIVDQSLEDTRIVRDLLQGEPDLRVHAARDASDARELLTSGSFDALLLDHALWCDDSAGLVPYIRECRPDMAIVLLTSGENEREALPALKLGAHDFISKKSLERGQLVARILGAVDESRTVRRRDTMVRWLEREARTDHLSGLYNRRAFDDELRSACALAKENDTPVALIFIDITGTRMVNEAHGHEAGDAMIRRASAAIARSLRAVDFAARVGGDDFAIIVPGGTLDLAKRIARRIAHEVERLNQEEWGRDIPVSLTFGVTSGAGCEPAQLMAAGEQQIGTRSLAPRQFVVPPPVREESDGPSVA